MKNVVEKLGFKKEGIDRELIVWKGDWIDRFRYGLFRNEWNEKGDDDLR